MKHKEFKALAQGKSDYEVEVIPIKSNGRFGTMMCVCADEGAIYVTKQQAKEFFGLEEMSDESN